MFAQQIVIQRRKKKEVISRDVIIIFLLLLLNHCTHKHCMLRHVKFSETMVFPPLTLFSE